MGERGRSRDGGALRTAAIVASALFHAVLLALLVRYAVHETPAYREPTIIQATLVPPDRPGPAHRDRASRRPSDNRDAPARTAPGLPVQAAAPPVLGDVAPFTPGDASPGAAPPGEADVAARGRQALRGLGGCDRVELTLKEREDCEAQRWAGVAQVAKRLNLDPSGRYARNPEPFLSRRPSKGCRVRVAGDVDGMGNDMNARAGVTCVKPF
jgi:hypothetical protein